MSSFVPLRDLKRCGERVTIHPGAMLVGVEHISIGGDVIIDSMAFIAATAECPVTIGSYVHIAGHTTISGGPVTIGDFANVGAGSRLIAGSDDFSGNHLVGPTVPAKLRGVDRPGISLGNFVTLGANCIIMPGCQVPEGLALGAGGILLLGDEYLPWEIWVGQPAKRRSARADSMKHWTPAGVRRWVKEQEL